MPAGRTGHAWPTNLEGVCVGEGQRPREQLPQDLRQVEGCCPMNRRAQGCQAGHICYRTCLCTSSTLLAEPPHRSVRKHVSLQLAGAAQHDFGRQPAPKPNARSQGRALLDTPQPATCPAGLQQQPTKPRCRWMARQPQPAQLLIPVPARRSPPRVAHHDGRGLAARFDCPAQVEVCQLHGPVVADEHVGALEVPVPAR